MIIPITAAAVPHPEHRVDGAAVYTNTPTADQTLTFAPDGLCGQLYIFRFVTSGTTSYTTTFGTGFQTTGTLASGTTTAKTFNVFFYSDGQKLSELSRTTAM